jgi:hypothetical protein
LNASLTRCPRLGPCPASARKELDLQLRSGRDWHSISAPWRAGYPAAPPPCRLGSPRRSCPSAAAPPGARVTASAPPGRRGLRDTSDCGSAGSGPPAAKRRVRAQPPAPSPAALRGWERRTPALSVRPCPPQSQACRGRGGRHRSGSLGPGAQVASRSALAVLGSLPAGRWLGLRVGGDSYSVQVFPGRQADTGANIYSRHKDFT